MVALLVCNGSMTYTWVTESLIISCPKAVTVVTRLHKLTSLCPSGSLSSVTQSLLSKVLLNGLIVAIGVTIFYFLQTNWLSMKTPLYKTSLFKV